MSSNPLRRGFLPWFSGTFCKQLNFSSSNLILRSYTPGKLCDRYLIAVINAWLDKKGRGHKRLSWKARPQVEKSAMISLSTAKIWLHFFSLTPVANLCHFFIFCNECLFWISELHYWARQPYIWPLSLLKSCRPSHINFLIRFTGSKM